MKGMQQYSNGPLMVNTLGMHVVRSGLGMGQHILNAGLGCRTLNRRTLHSSDTSGCSGKDSGRFRMFSKVSSRFFPRKGVKPYSSS